MKKAEFKKLIKECIKEAIIEDGVLSTVISEVVRGLNVGQIVEAKPVVSEQAREEQTNLELQKEQEMSKKQLE